MGSKRSKAEFLDVHRLGRCARDRETAVDKFDVFGRRLELMRGNRDDGLRLLRELAEAYPQTLVPVMALWDFRARYELPPHEVQRWTVLVRAIRAP